MRVLFIYLFLQLVNTEGVTLAVCINTHSCRHTHAHAQVHTLLTPLKITQSPHLPDITRIPLMWSLLLFTSERPQIYKHVCANQPVWLSESL